MRSEHNVRSLLLLTLLVIGAVALGLLALSGRYSPMQAQQTTSKAGDPRLRKAWRFQRGGWTYVHLEGPPAEIGYQHGYLLAPEIADAFQAVKLEDTHNSKRREFGYFCFFSFSFFGNVPGPGRLFLGQCS